MVTAQSDRAPFARKPLNRLRSVLARDHGRGRGWPVAWLPVLALCALAAVDFRALAPLFAAAALVWGLLAVAAALAAGPRERRSADDGARRAVDRALAAEKAQRARADELADVLRASEGLVSQAQDQVLEMRRVQQQLVQVAKLGAVGELAAAVAHEVNNPLTGILGFSELLLAELPADDPRHQEVAIIQAEAVRARAIVRSLLEFARPRPPQRVPTDLDELVRSTVDLIRFRAHEANVWIAEEYGQLPSVEVDPDAFKQVVLNLLNNAIEAMPQGGKLQVATAAEGERVRVTIGDNGVGMDEGIRSRIFTPFFTTRTGKGTGTGLGLSMSLQIVESHGGTIEVDSEPGRGAVFSVRLPGSRQEREAAGAIAPDPDAVLVAAASRPGAGDEPPGTGGAA
jgi:signal transduction histidine kinase